MKKLYVGLLRALVTYNIQGSFDNAQGESLFRAVNSLYFGLLRALVTYNKQGSFDNAQGSLKTLI